ncbi:MAG: sigma-70 family RNA polymerase sigma factor [Clostridia bacterium]|nr:sigma-70 family RNA polymerase sigma factor [Clostridia bacterium]
MRQIDTETLNQLVIKAQQKDTVAIEQVFDYFKPYVRGIANSYFLLGGEKEDLLQEGMVGLFGAINNYDNTKGSFTTFALLCIRRRMLTVIDSANKDKNKPLLLASPLEDNIVDEGASPLEMAINNDLLSTVKHYIATQLTALEKYVLEYYTQGYTREEICHLSNKSYKSVDGALGRARKKLEHLKETI